MRLRVPRTWYSLLLSAFLFVAVPVLADPPANYPFVSFDEGLQQALRDGRPIFLYFGRYGCGWCDKTNREAFSDPKLRELYTQRYVLVYVDSESGRRLRLPSGERISERDFGARMKVLATPVFAYLKQDGQEIFHIPGIQSSRDFFLYDRFVSEGHYKNESIRDFLAREMR